MPIEILPKSKRVLLEVITVNRETGVEEDRRKTDYARGPSRVWLQNHIFWAAYHGKGVAINPISVTDIEPA